MRFFHGKKQCFSRRELKLQREGGDNMKERIKGGLMGLAVGDALGVTTEFLLPAEIQKLYGVHDTMIGGGKHGIWEIGEVSDDTEMTMCVAKGIIENPDDPIGPIGDRFDLWLQTKPKDAGYTIRTSYRMYKITKDWFVAAEKTHAMLNEKSAGNGSLMRCLPIALAYDDVTLIQELSRIQSKLTHFDPLAGEACAIHNTIAHDVLEGMELTEAITKSIRGTIYESVLSQEPNFHPDEFVVHTFSWVLSILLRTESYREAVLTAVNKGYDADTTGAIVGGLAGMYYGYESIPKEWKNAVLKKDSILSLSNDLHTIRMGK